LASFKIIQVVGFKNSGKTTLIETWIQLLAAKQLRSAVIKHHGHGGPLALPAREADSMRVLSAGAVSSIACDGERVQLHTQGRSPSLPDLLEMAKLAKPDVLFIEGYKEADYPKVVLVREIGDWVELGKLSNIRGVIVHDGVKLDGAACIERSDSQGISKLLHSWMDGE
jgi:molybdopterin-guanine dinucleotide biosynthesis protein B